MKQEYLASQLLSGKSKSPCRTGWWPRHSREMSIYLSACSRGPMAKVVKLKAQMSELAHEWERAIYNQKLSLMSEHVELEMDIVDAAMRHDTSGLEMTADQLVRNAKAQAQWFSKEIQDFPHDRYLKLLCQHVNLYIKSVDARLDENANSFIQTEEARSRNSIALAHLSTEWL